MVVCKPERRFRESRFRESHFRELRFFANFRFSAIRHSDQRPYRETASHCKEAHYIMNTFLRAAFVAAALCAALHAGGCTNYYKEQFHDSDSDYGSERAFQEGNRSPAYRLYADRPSDHDNRRLFVSEQAMYRVDDVQGVGAAVVVITDRNAYVGVMTDNTSTGTFGKGNSSDVNNAGTSEGVYDIYSGSAKADPRLLATRTNNLFTVPGREPLSGKLMQNVALKIRDMHPHVMNVFISANRDFVNALNSYASDFRKGLPLDRRIDEFNQMVSVMFPLAPAGGGGGIGSANENGAEGTGNDSDAARDHRSDKEDGFDARNMIRNIFDGERNGRSRQGAE